MSYKEFAPCDELKPYVECFWTQSSSDTVVIPHLSFDKIVPDGCIDFLFRIEPTLNQSSVTASIIGTMTTSIDVPKGNSKIVAVRFKPGGSLPFLSTPANLITDQDIDLASVWGDRISQLTDQIFNAVDLYQATQVLEKELLTKLHTSQNINPIITRLIDSIETRIEDVTVDDFIQIYGKSSRQLERLFLTHVGIGPKMFLRIKRFQSVDRSLRLIPEVVDWADLAVKNGYFDQSHLIRDCKLMTSLTPVNYRKFLKMSYFSNPIPLNSYI